MQRDSVNRRQVCDTAYMRQLVVTADNTTLGVLTRITVVYKLVSPPYFDRPHPTLEHECTLVCFSTNLGSSGPITFLVYILYLVFTSCLSVYYCTASLPGGGAADSLPADHGGSPESYHGQHDCGGDLQGQADILY